MCSGSRPRAAIPSCTLVEFPDLGHAPQIQTPERFHKALLQWLGCWREVREHASSAGCLCCRKSIVQLFIELFVASRGSASWYSSAGAVCHGSLSLFLSLSETACSLPRNAGPEDRVRRTDSELTCISCSGMTP
jgi:hypothetical protein